MSKIDDLVVRFNELSGSLPDGRWSVSTLAEKVEKLEAEAAARKQSKMQAEKEEQKAKEDREARIADRGDFDTFVSRAYGNENVGPRSLVRVVRWAKQHIDDHAQISEKFAEDFAKNPQYTMSWSGKYFDHAAQYNVAKQIQAMFENGTSVEDMLSVAMREVMHKAKWPANSTSPTSNLCDTTELSVWTKVAGYLNGSEMF